MLQSINYINITHNDINEFINNALTEIRDLDTDYNLLAFYRGGLPIGVNISHATSKELHVIFIQTRDKKSDYESMIFPEIDQSKPMVVFEDIIDSGSTIDAFMDLVGHDAHVHLFSLVVIQQQMRRLIMEYPNLKIYHYKKYNSLLNSWIIFPWEADPTVESNKTELHDNTEIDSKDESFLISDSRKLFDEALNTMIKKNHDYTGKDSDPFKNFKNVEQLGISSVEQGILVRLSDKFSRLSGLLVNRLDPKVKSESVHDTIQDAINYLAILNSYLKNKGE